VTPSSAESGTAFDIAVVAVDPYGNVDTNYTGTVTFTSSDPDPGAVLPADYTFQPSDQGIATFPGGVTLITSGDQTITATDTASGINGTAVVTVTTGNAVWQLWGVASLPATPSSTPDQPPTRQAAAEPLAQRPSRLEADSAFALAFRAWHVQDAMFKEIGDPEVEDLAAPLDRGGS
jgi:hypothetical protein